MTYFIDANVIVYSAVPSPYRKPCLEILQAIARGDLEGQTSPPVLEEVWYLELSGRAGVLDGLTSRAYSLFTPLLEVTDEAFRLALTVDGPASLGPNDRLHTGTCWAHEIKAMISADAGFDRVKGIRRIDPLNRGALLKLGVGT